MTNRMLTTQDETRIRTIVREEIGGIGLATKEELVSSERATRGDIRKLQTFIENFSKHMEDLKQEQTMHSLILTRHGSWLHRLANNAGIKLDY